MLYFILILANNYQQQDVNKNIKNQVLQPDMKRNILMVVRLLLQKLNYEQILYAQ